MKLCQHGGCSAKLGPRALHRVLSKLPRMQDDNLLVGYDSSDDASVYKINDEVAMIQTLDFFPAMVEDPYIFGQIAATNAVSDIYAMGGQVKTAQNIVCFPETEDLNILGEIMAGGASKIAEAGGVLSGGHSINDDTIKYGLAVTGLVHPAHIYRNDTPQAGDYLILTKPLGVGLIMAANSVGEVDSAGLQAAIASMTRLNKQASEILPEFTVHAVTDVTGFGLCGHLLEMLNHKYSATIELQALPIIPEAISCAQRFLWTSAGQRNRKFAGLQVSFSNNITLAEEELVFDPQTSGGLLISVAANQGQQLCKRLVEMGYQAELIGQIEALDTQTAIKFY